MNDFTVRLDDETLEQYKAIADIKGLDVEQLLSEQLSQHIDGLKQDIRRKTFVKPKLKVLIGNQKDN